MTVITIIIIIITITITVITIVAITATITATIAIIRGHGAGLTNEAITTTNNTQRKHTHAISFIIARHIQNITLIQSTSHIKLL